MRRCRPARPGAWVRRWGVWRRSAGDRIGAADVRGVVEEAATRAFLDGFNHIIVVAAVIAFAGAVLSLLLIRDRDLTAPGPPA